jgi:hypothetical protein
MAAEEERLAAFEQTCCVVEPLQVVAVGFGHSSGLQGLSPYYH